MFLLLECISVRLFVILSCKIRLDWFIECLHVCESTVDLINSSQKICRVILLFLFSSEYGEIC